MSYNKLAEEYNFNTGDILLFSHKDNCSSCCNCLMSCFTNCIKCCTGSQFTHAAIIVKDPYWRPDLKGYYVLQSSYENFPDAEDNELKLGVELCKLDQVINSTKGKIYWRKLECDRNNEFKEKMIKIHSVVHNRPYDMNPYDWFRAAFHIDLGCVHRLDEFWCSALVAYIYTELGFLPASTPWTLISPKMLSSTCRNGVNFINCRVYEDILIKN